MTNTRKRSKPSIKTTKVHDIFQSGLVRGEASFAHKPEKKVFYIQDPKEGWRVFLRAVCFLHEEGQEEAGRFLVLKRSGAEASGPVWEAPKGQMEGKDGFAHPSWSVLQLLEQNIRREVEEEAKVRKFVRLEYLPKLVIESKEAEYESNDFFQYHVFRAIVKPSVIKKAMKTFTYYKRHPEKFALLDSDNNEKDEAAWYDRDKTQLMGKWSPTLVRLYLNYLKKRT